MGETAGLHCVIWVSFRNRLVTSKVLPWTSSTSIFANVSYFPSITTEEAGTIFESAATEGFCLKPVSYVDVVVAVSHFSFQARGVDDISQSIVTKALPILGPLMVVHFNTSLSTGIFPEAWISVQLVPLKNGHAFSPLELLPDSL